MSTRIPVGMNKGLKTAITIRYKYGKAESSANSSIMWKAEKGKKEDDTDSKTGLNRGGLVSAIIADCETN